MGDLRLFMQGIIPGDTVPERIARPDLDSFLRAPATQESLNEFLARAAAAVPGAFRRADHLLRASGRVGGLDGIRRGRR